MNFIKKYLLDLFLKQRIYIGLSGLIVLFLIAFYIPVLEPIAWVALIVFIVFCIIDYSLLFFTKKYLHTRRVTGHRFSNGDENPIEIVVKNEFTFPVDATVIDELPEQLQIRNWKRKVNLRSRQQKKILWLLKKSPKI